MSVVQYAVRQDCMFVAKVDCLGDEERALAIQRDLLHALREAGVTPWDEENSGASEARDSASNSTSTAAAEVPDAHPNQATGGTDAQQNRALGSTKPTATR